MLDQVVEKLVDAQFQPRARVQSNGEDAERCRFASAPADGVMSVMKKNLSAEQWSRYERREAEAG